MNALLYALSRGRCAGCVYEERPLSPSELFGLTKQHIVANGLTGLGGEVTVRLPGLIATMEKEHLAFDDLETNLQNLVMVCKVHNDVQDEAIVEATQKQLANPCAPELDTLLQDWWTGRVSRMRQWRNGRDRHGARHGLSDLATDQVMSLWDVRNRLVDAYNHPLACSDTVSLYPFVLARDIPNAAAAEFVGVAAAMLCCLEENHDQLIDRASNSGQRLVQLRELVRGDMRYEVSSRLGHNLPKLLSQPATHGAAKPHLLPHELLKQLFRELRDRIRQTAFIENAIHVFSIANRVNLGFPTYGEDYRFYESITATLHASVNVFGFPSYHLSPKEVDLSRFVDVPRLLDIIESAHRCHYHSYGALCHRSSMDMHAAIECLTNCAVVVARAITSAFDETIIKELDTFRIIPCGSNQCACQRVK
jgi:hypothetical protein